MAAPTSAVQTLQKILANGEPSTDGLLRREEAGKSTPTRRRALLAAQPSIGKRNPSPEKPEKLTWAE